MTENLAIYVAASMALILTPGQDMIYVIGRSLAQGRVAGLCSAIGVIIGILVHTALAGIGVGAILHASEGLFMVLKLVGAAYLAYLGVRMLFTREVAIDASSGGPRTSLAWLVLQGILSNVTNPKIILFFFAFLPQFVDPASGHPTRDLIALGMLYAMLGLPVKCGVALIAARLSDRMRRKPAALVWMNRACGALLVGLGVRLARG
jgi:threonine/homoserine/homoserine lactone efflux protein